MAAAKFPEEAAKVREQLDTVVGHDNGRCPIASSCVSQRILIAGESSYV